MQTIDTLLSVGKDRHYILTNADGKSWSFPIRNLRLAMELYQPSGSKGKMLKRLFPYLHRLSVVRRVARAKIVRGCLDEEILKVAREGFGVGNIEYSIFGGTPSVHQKITIQFFTGNRILGYGKMTDSEAIAALFAHEQDLLATLHQQGISDIPECLFNAKLQSGAYFFLQTTVKTLNSRSPEEWTTLHENFLQNLSVRTSAFLPFVESDFYRSLHSLQASLSSIPSEYCQIILPALLQTFEEFSGGTYPFSAYHADFTPWNMFVNDGRLFVFDWEYGRMSYPPMLDRYHFFVQQYIHVRHMSADEICRQLGEYAWFDETQFRYYLLDVISRFVCRENGAISKDLAKMLEIWTKLLGYLK